MTDAEYSAIAAFIVSFFAWVAWTAIRRPPPAQEPQDDPEDEPDDFEFLTVREQIAAVKCTSDQLGDLEQLRTDMDMCNADDVSVVHLEWLGRDNAKHEYDLFCTGDNTATDCLKLITEREIHDLRSILAFQCVTLTERVRSRKNDRKNIADMIGDESDAIQTMRDLWEADCDS